jgi:hypothetical protein
MTRLGDVAAEVRQRLDRFVHECVRIAWIGEAVRARAERLDAETGNRIDLALDDALGASVESAEGDDLSAVLARRAHAERAYVPERWESER